MNWGSTYKKSRKMTDLNFFKESKTASSAESLHPLRINEGIKKALNCFRACGDKWTRTIDSRIFSPMLYQLSYITLLK